MTAPPAGLTVVSADPRTDSRWQTMTETAGSVFTSPQWIRAVCDSYGFIPQARMTLDSAGVASNGFAWVPLEDITGRRLKSLPFSDRAEPIISDLGAWPCLADDAINDPAPISIRCMAGAVPASDPRLEQVAEAAWHGTVLDAPPDALHLSLHPSARKDIAFAHRQGVYVRESSSLDAVRAFHAIHLSLRKNKYHLLAQSVEFFERIWEEFSGTGGIITLLAYSGEDPVAGGIFLGWRDTLYCKFAASLAGALHVRPNYAVYWHALKWASERGYRLVDWGLSDLDQPGLIAYKRKWADAESRIVTLRRPGPVPDKAVGSGRLLEDLTALFTDDAVPDSITARGGSLLYRYFA